MEDNTIHTIKNLALYDPDRRKSQQIGDWYAHRGEFAPKPCFLCGKPIVDKCICLNGFDFEVNQNDDFPAHIECVRELSKVLPEFLDEMENTIHEEK